MTIQYDPPVDLNVYETQIIGAALNTQLLEMARSAAYMEIHLKAQIGCHEVYTEEKVEKAIKREWGQVQNAYKVLCRFVTNPLDYEFFVKSGHHQAQAMEKSQELMGEAVAPIFHIPSVDRYVCGWCGENIAHQGSVQTHIDFHQQTIKELREMYGEPNG